MFFMLSLRLGKKRSSLVTRFYPFIRKKIIDKMDIIVFVIFFIHVQQKLRRVSEKF